MQIIISPAKKMLVDRDSFKVETMPKFLDKSRILEKYLKSRSQDELQKLWKSSDRITKEGLKQLEVMDLDHNLTPALVAYHGIQYQYMAADIFSQKGLDYAKDHLKILSGFYGILRPFDGVTPYRLEMNAKMTGFRDYSLYHYWGDLIAKELYKDNDIVINLASKEYSRAIRPYTDSQRKMIDIDFLEERNGKWKTIGTHAKMARGEMARYICENQIKNPTELQDFHDFEFIFDKENSTETNYIFRTNFDFKRR